MAQVGNIDTSLHAARKCWLTDGETTICGVWGSGTSINIVANWESPFSGMTPGQVKPITGALLQAITGKSLLTAQNSRQTWVSNEPTQISLEMKFYALQDPVTEVMEPLRQLEMLIAPGVKSYIGMGEIAKGLTLTIARRRMYDNLVLKSVSVPFDTEVNSNGDFVRATVTLELSTLTMMTKDMLSNDHQGFWGVIQ